MSEAVHIVCPHCQAINRVPRERLQAGGNCGKCKQALFTGRPLELSGAAFERVVKHTQLPVLVDFWAPWCGPCKSFAPVFEQAAAELEPQVRLVKLNTQSEQTLAQRHGIRSIPTLALFKDGREVARQAGAMDKAGLKRWIASIMR